MRAIRDTDAAITGLGLVTPLAFGVEATRAALAEGRDPRSRVGNEGDPEETRRAARVEEPWLREPIPDEHAGQAKFLTGSGQMAVTAVREALAGTHLPAGAGPDPRRGLFLAQMDWTCIEYADFRPAFVEATDGFTKPFTAEGLNTATLRKLNPFYLLDTLNNNAYSFVTALLGFMGPGTSLSGPAGPGLLTVSMAARAIRRGDADVMLAVGAGRWTTPIARLELARRSAASPDAPATLPGEGAAAVVLEPFAAARARGATIHAVVLGWGAGFGTDAVKTATRDALADASGPDGERDPRPTATPVDRARLGDMGPASDVAAVVLAARDAASEPGGARVLLARGLDGQAVALVLARPS